MIVFFGGVFFHIYFSLGLFSVSSLFLFSSFSFFLGFSKSCSSFLFGQQP